VPCIQTTSSVASRILFHDDTIGKARVCRFLQSTLPTEVEVAFGQRVKRNEPPVDTTWVDTRDGLSRIRHV
jgi:hypothetical protein